MDEQKDPPPTLLDAFAGLAMHASLQRHETEAVNDMPMYAQWCYELAKAMMEERKKHHG